MEFTCNNFLTISGIFKRVPFNYFWLPRRMATYALQFPWEELVSIADLPSIYHAFNSGSSGNGFVFWQQRLGQSCDDVIAWDR